MAPKKEALADIEWGVPLGALGIIKEADPWVIYFSANVLAMARRCV